MASCVSKNKYQKDTCLKKISIHSKNMKFVPNLNINIIKGRDLYDNNLMNTKTFIVITKKMFI